MAQRKIPKPRLKKKTLKILRIEAIPLVKVITKTDIVPASKPKRRRR
jgi:hypothetical protein